MSRSVPGSPAERRYSLTGLAVRRGLALAATVVAVLVTPSTSQAELVESPATDPWYAAPADIASMAPAQIIRSRSVHIRLGPSIKLPYTAHQVLFKTTDRSGAPIATATTIIIPTKRPATNRRLVSYQTAYDGLSAACQPSFSLRSGRVALQGAEVLLMVNLLSRGWTVVTTDYEGPNNNWGVAETTAHGVLDGIRAAESFAPAGLTDGVKTKVGMVGYSGGGNASAWANEWATSYAPELNIVGAAFGGVGPRLQRVVSALNGQLFAGIAFAGIVGVTSGYPEFDLKSHLNRQGLQMYKDLKSKYYSCITDFVMKYAFQKFSSYLKGDSKGLLGSPEILAIGEENSLGRFTPKAPMFWYQTRFDQMNGYWISRDIARGYCKAGVKVNFNTNSQVEHAIEAFTMPWPAYAWLSQRFSDAPMVDNCSTL